MDIANNIFIFLGIIIISVIIIIFLIALLQPKGKATHSSTDTVEYPLRDGRKIILSKWDAFNKLSILYG